MSSLPSETGICNIIQSVFSSVKILRYTLSFQTTNSAAFFSCPRKSNCFLILYSCQLLKFSILKFKIDSFVNVKDHEGQNHVCEKFKELLTFPVHQGSNILILLWNACDL